MSRKPNLKDAGGTEGGCGLFTVGFALAAGALYFFFDSVRITTMNMGLMSGLAHRGMAGMGLGGGGNMHDMYQTTSMGILFVPFFIGVVLLFYNHKMLIGRALTVLGLGILVVEIMSRIRFIMHMKSSHLLLMTIAFAAGLGLILRSFRDEGSGEEEKPATESKDEGGE